MANWHFVDRETVAKVLEACPTAELRLVFALARFGGLRCPSEIQLLTWADVLWDQDRLRVTSPKTEHHEGGGERFTPIFPELRPHLEAGFEAAQPGTVHVVRTHRNPDQIYRKTFTAILRRAGVIQWPRLFHNLRATRQTELTKDYPSHVVCAWLGNSETVAAKHYLRVTDDDFRRAAKSGAVTPEMVQKPVQSGQGGNCPELTEPIVPYELVQAQSSRDKSEHKHRVAAVGLEPTRPLPNGGF